MSDFAKQFFETDFTSKVHSTVYPTISPTRPELDQTGKTILVTGGATNIGLNITKGFIEAKAARVIIVGRRSNVLDDAKKTLEAFAASLGHDVEIITRQGDQSESEDVRKLWAELEHLGIAVDVLVLSAADFSNEKPVLGIGADAVWSSFKTNLRGPLDMVEGLAKQQSSSPKAVLNVSTQAINMFYNSQLAAAAVRPVYGLTKNSGTLLLQQIAKDVSPEQLQIISFHPGVVHNENYTAVGIKKEDLPFTDPSLPGAFAVWASTKEARFLHGRFVWANWDIDEYSVGETRERLEKDPEYLRIGIVGLHGAFRS
ncbi:hypothetical protein BGZ63DRAFT_426319 [Mariannaea sp. PMI_226]|nr:hypothetical protein BGZ63DRAFT_426319 [Mariannaea sp. PMI_226]